MTGSPFAEPAPGWHPRVEWRTTMPPARDGEWALFNQVRQLTVHDDARHCWVPPVIGWWDQSGRTHCTACPPDDPAAADEIDAGNSAAIGCACDFCGAGILAAALGLGEAARIAAGYLEARGVDNASRAIVLAEAARLPGRYAYTPDRKFRVIKTPDGRYSAGQAPAPVGRVLGS